jgi:hypothetical protein
MRKLKNRSRNGLRQIVNSNRVSLKNAGKINSKSQLAAIPANLSLSSRSIALSYNSYYN